MPSASSTSVAAVRGVAPSRSSAFVPRRERGRDLAGDGEDLAPFLEREVGGDQGAAALARLHDDGRRARAPATIRLRAGKRHGAGSTPGAYSETTRPRSPIARRQLRVRGRVVAVDAAAEHCDGDAARLERAAVGLAVDAAREAADDDEPGCRELTAAASGRPASRTASTPGRRRSRRPAREQLELAGSRARTAPAADRGSPRSSGGNRGSVRPTKRRSRAASDAR